MTATINSTETQALSLLRAFILSVIPEPFECIRGLQNRVSEPNTPDFAVMTPLFKKRLATNLATYQDLVYAGRRIETAQTEFTIQVDFHGPSSGDNSQIFTTLWRSEVATSFFDTTLMSQNISTGTASIVTETGAFIVATYLLAAAPLYCAEPRQMAFINGENQYEERWSVDAAMQINPAIQTVQQFADQLVVNIVEVDAAYPP